jgi:opacity protein-like surface antigen
MVRIRTLTLAAVAALALVALPGKAEAQLRFGVHTAMADGGDFLPDNTFGLGARIGFSPPAVPLSILGTVDYFFPDCDECGYQNFALDANFTFLPLQVAELYATGGVLGRRISGANDSTTKTGFSLGAGVSFNFIVSAYLEARNEFFSDENGGNQILLRLGLLF